MRQRASECLRQVEAGQTLEVTARGRPVALLVPVRKTGHLERLVARGRIVPGSGDLLGLGPPLPPARRAPAPSDLLARIRAGER